MEKVLPHKEGLEGTDDADVEHEGDYYQLWFGEKLLKATGTTAYVMGYYLGFVVC